MLFFLRYNVWIFHFPLHLSLAFYFVLGISVPEEGKKVKEDESGEQETQSIPVAHIVPYMRDNTIVEGFGIKP